ncbi:MAG: 1-acyl-sn-glycerol-3-phosphate acyltransferase [Myxococcaceae bacterium]|nr:1-acyl-sn-glycerol-3-phosphate acyltransferase [Myxococcaceae bacterium]MBH2006810.1 1-acyl-sn-glycerol-3-phosphate acyltransferase [Myxococcaceae bacterium]
MFRKIKYSDDQAFSLRSLAEEGVVVYVHRTRSVLLHWVLASMIARYELPEILYSTFKASKVSNLIRAVRLATGSIEIFLRKANTAFSQRSSEKRDYIKTLIRIQKSSETPIFLVPHFLVLGNRSSSLKPSAVDMIFGSRNDPGFVRLLLRLLLFRNSGQWATAEPLNLKAFLEQNPHATDVVLSRRTRGILQKRFKGLARAFHGPSLKSTNRIQVDTLRDHDLQNFMMEVEKQTGLPRVKLFKKAQEYYLRIAARFDVDMIHLINQVFGFVWNRIYDGVVWKKSDIEKIKQASQKGPVILVPAHRSHMDYLVLSQIFYWEGLMVPHIAAGENLSFFPLGIIFRRGGAYFIRRSFKGDPLYSQVVRAYLKKLLREGYTQEFFIEGGRSRSGKTLPPKLGLLSIMVDCLSKSKLYEATFIPVSISYEKLLEANEYRRELEGAEKRAESRGDIFRSLKILRKRYGRIFVNFDEPISFTEFYQTGQVDLVPRLAHRIMAGIQRSTVVTPVSLVATALMGSKRRILSRGQIEWSIKRLAQYVQIPKPSLEKVLHNLIHDELIVCETAGRRLYYRVPEKAALSLDYYKNNLIHHFAADAILAMAFQISARGDRRKSVKRSILHKQALLLSRIFKFEFSYSVDENLENIFEQRLNEGIEAKILLRVQDQIRLSESKEAFSQLSFMANLLANFVDAYWVCARKLESALLKAPTRKILVGLLLDCLREAVLSGASDYPEIVSKSLVENAIMWFEDAGILVWEQGKARMKADKKPDFKIYLQALQDCHYGN